MSSTSSSSSTPVPLAQRCKLRSATRQEEEREKAPIVPLSEIEKGDEEEEIKEIEPPNPLASRAASPIPGYPGVFRTRPYDRLYTKIMLEYTTPIQHTCTEIQLGLNSLLSEEEQWQVDPPIHAALIDACVQWSAAIAHDQNETLAREVDARMESIHHKVSSLAQQSVALKDMIKHAVQSAMDQIMDTTVQVGWDLRAEYQDAIDKLRTDLTKRLDEKLEDMEDALAERCEKLEEEMKRNRRNPSVPNPPPHTVHVLPPIGTQAQAQAQAATIPTAPAYIPKIPPPAKFSGSSSKIMAQEWVEKMGLYFGTLKIFDDEERIRQALFCITGDAYKFVSPMIKKVANGEPLGTWEAFTKSLLNQYGQQMDKEIAKKEIRGYYGEAGKKLANEQYFHYCERFWTLGRLSEMDQATLVWEFMETLLEKVKDTLNMLSRTPFFQKPKEIEALIDFSLEVYQSAYPDKIKGMIFRETKKKEEKKKVETTTTTPATASKKAAGKGKEKAKTNTDTTHSPVVGLALSQENPLARLRNHLRVTKSSEPEGVALVEAEVVRLS